VHFWLDRVTGLDVAGAQRAGRVEADGPQVSPNVAIAAHPTANAGTAPIQRNLAPPV
jgi:hypothetical protein